MLLTIAHAARRLTVSVSTVRRLTLAGMLPIIRISPRRVGIPEQAIAEYGGYKWPSGRGDSPVPGLSSYSSMEAAYSSVCQPVSRKRKRGSTKRRSGGSSLTGDRSSISPKSA